TKYQLLIIQDLELDQLRIIKSHERSIFLLSVSSSTPHFRNYEDNKGFDQTLKNLVLKVTETLLVRSMDIKKIENQQSRSLLIVKTKTVINFFNLNFLIHVQINIFKSHEKTIFPCRSISWVKINKFTNQHQRKKN
ncbi:hypothetical protein BpHYR1_030903, partial [Brachionus plicatilis]